MSRVALAKVDPIYIPSNCKAAYQLNWSLSIFWRGRPLDENWFATLIAQTEADGVRILNHASKSPNISQFLVSTRPNLPPTEISRIVKARLQRIVRDFRPKAFQRNYLIRSVGSAHRKAIERYVERQIEGLEFADLRVGDMLESLLINAPDVDLSAPFRASHAISWCNLHLVLVNAERWREVDEERLAALRAMILKVAAKNGDRISRGAILWDHIHLALGFHPSRSPEMVAPSYLNNLAYALGMKRIFQFGYYVGTFGEYDLGAIPRPDE